MYINIYSTNEGHQNHLATDTQKLEKWEDSSVLLKFGWESFSLAYTQILKQLSRLLGVSTK